MNEYCARPFTMACIDDRGYLSLPCGWCEGVKLTVGNILGKSVDEVWNSGAARNIRKKILSRTFPCDKKRCQRFETTDLEYNTEFNLQGLLKAEMPAPTELKISTDKGCNLRCPSCGDFDRRSTPKDQVNRLISSITSSYLEHVRYLVLPTYGELFVSIPTMDWLSTINPKTYPNLKILIYTNGQLLCNRWDRIKNVAPMLDGISVSIDASSLATYKKMRGGSWSKIFNTMDYLKNITDKREVSFVVQKDNFREMPAFVELAAKWKAIALFQRIRFIEGRFKKDVADSRHPSYFEFKKIRDLIIDKPNIIWDVYLKDQYETSRIRVMKRL